MQIMFLGHKVENHRPYTKMCLSMILNLAAVATRFKIIGQHTVVSGKG